jgi:hypothetical protein
MKLLFQPWQFVLLTLADWVQRQQQQVIDYLGTENQILKEKLGQGRLFLNDNQRRRLAVKGKPLGRKRLSQVATLVAADTILRWHRELVPQNAASTACGQRPVGRKPISAEIRQLVVRMATENLSWGYDRIQGAMANLGYEVSASSVGNILRDHGIEPAPWRKHQQTWETFVKAHWEALAKIDLRTITAGLGTWLIALQLLSGIKTLRRNNRLSCLEAPDPIRRFQIAPVNRNPIHASGQSPNRRLDGLPKLSKTLRIISGESEVKPVWLRSSSFAVNVDGTPLREDQREGWQECGRRAA